MEWRLSFRGAYHPRQCSHLLRWNEAAEPDGTHLLHAGPHVAGRAWHAFRSEYARHAAGSVRGSGQWRRPAELLGLPVLHEQSQVRRSQNDAGLLPAADATTVYGAADAGTGGPYQ